MIEGRYVRGERHHFAKLTETQVGQIRYLLEQREKVRKLMKNLTYEAIGRRCGIGRNAVYHIAKGDSWRRCE